MNKTKKKKFSPAPNLSLLLLSYSANSLKYISKQKAV